MEAHLKPQRPHALTPYENDEKPDHAGLIAIHRRHYMIHATAMTKTPKAREVLYQDDCGWNYHPINFALVTAIERHLGFDGDPIAQRTTLCERIFNGDPTPEIDVHLDIYVRKLTGEFYRAA